MWCCVLSTLPFQTKTYYRLKSNIRKYMYKVLLIYYYKLHKHTFVSFTCFIYCYVGSSFNYKGRSRGKWDFIQLSAHNQRGYAKEKSINIIIK